MRRVTRNLLLGIALVLVLLLALGAVPSLLRSGDPYYVSATPVGDANGTVAADVSRGDETAGPANVTTRATAAVINASALSGRAFSFTTGALADAGANHTGYSDPYWRGPVGFKEPFTHSPFDELASLRQRAPNATDGDTVRLADNGTLYRAGVTQDQS
jgi:hypothetical protein